MQLIATVLRDKSAAGSVEVEPLAVSDAADITLLCREDLTSFVSVVNDELVITGKFHVAEDWPRGVPKPDAAYLNVSSPGPVFVRTERYQNGQASVSSAALKLGGDYDFKIVLKARLPGRYHLHPFFNLHDAGAVMGPGRWLKSSAIRQLSPIK